MKESLEDRTEGAAVRGMHHAHAAPSEEVRHVPDREFAYSGGCQCCDCVHGLIVRG